MVKNLYSSHIKKCRLTPYILTFILIFIFIYFISGSFFGVHIGFNTTSPDSARSLLSTLIQSEAAILAIVITLSLVAVQQTATSYSPRVIQVFMNWMINPDFYLLTLIYLVSMVYGMWVLKQIWGDSGNIVDFDHSFFNSFETHIWFSYVLGTFSFFSLAIYIRNTLDLLKPSNIIEKISEKITDKTILSFHYIQNDEIGNQLPEQTPEDENNIEEREIKFFQNQLNKKSFLIKSDSILSKKIFDDNPIQQILDIIVSSEIKHDFATAKYGYKRIIDCTNSFAISQIDNNLHLPIVKAFKTFGSFSVTQNDRESALILIDYLHGIGIKAVDNKETTLINLTINSLCEIAKVATGQKLEDITIWALLSIKDIGIEIIKKDLSTVDISVIEINLRSIGKRAVEQRLESEAIFVARIINEICKELINKNLKVDIRQSIKYLEEIGKFSIKQELEMSISMVGIILNEIETEVLKLDPGDKASKEKLSEFDTLITSTLYSIGMFGISAAEHKFELPAKNTLITLKDIGIYAAERKFEIATKGSLSLIKDIGIQLINQEINNDSVVKDVVSYLREIGEISVKNDMYEQTIDAVSFIDHIGDLVVRKNTANSIRILSSFQNIAVLAIQKSPTCGIDQNLMYIINKITIAIEKFGVKAVEQKMNNDANNSIRVLKDIADFSIDLRNEYYLIDTVQSIEEIGKLSVIKKLRHSTENAVISIREIGSKAIQRKLNQIAYQSQISLENIASLATDTKLFNDSIILESLEELNDNIIAYDITNM
ncbi:DUF2254 family protein [Methanosarcina hadiensis]|uniref:DUF2254 family protein n=1 Tax=Methanosarcina hadiensis TaxID=3078083 RepID=UPI00397731DC